MTGRSCRFLMLSLLMSMAALFPVSLMAGEEPEDLVAGAYLRHGYRSDAPEYARKYARGWPYLRYPVRKDELSDGWETVIDNVRLHCSADRGRVTWGAACFRPRALRNAYLMFNAFDLGSDEDYAAMEKKTAEGPLGPETMALLARLAPLYLHRTVGVDPEKATEVRKALLRILVGHAQIYFEFEDGSCFVGDGKGSLSKTPGLVVSYDGRGETRGKYDPFAGLDERKYDALFNVVDVRDAMRWSTTSDTSSTFFRLRLDGVATRRLFDRILAIALGERPLKRFDDGRSVTIAEHRYHLLYHSCINTVMRLVNESFDPARRLPEVFNICDGIVPAEKQGDDELCRLFEDMRIPSAETTVYGVAGNALVERGLADRLDDYPPALRAFMDRNDDVDLDPSYPVGHVVDREEIEAWMHDGLNRR